MPSRRKPSEPTLWRLHNLSEARKNISQTAWDKVLERYKTSAPNPPVRHISVNGEVTELGEGPSNLTVVAAHLDPLPYSHWGIPRHRIDCRNQEQGNGGHTYHPQPHVLTHVPVEAHDTGKRGVVLRIAKFQGMGTDTSTYEEVTLRPSRDTSTPHHPLLGQLGLPRGPEKSMMAAGYSAISKEKLLMVWGLGSHQGKSASPLLIASLNTDSPGHRRYAIVLHRGIYNPRVMILQPFALVPLVLRPGERASSSLILLDLGEEWLGIAAKEPILIKNRQGSLQAYPRSSILLTGPSKNPPLHMIALWGALASPRSIAECTTPRVTLGDPRIIVSRAAWRSLGGHTWEARIDLTNPTGHNVAARLRVEPPNFVDEASIEGEPLIPEDRNSINLFIPRYHSTRIVLKTRKSRLFQLIGRGTAGLARG